MQVSFHISRKQYTSVFLLWLYSFLGIEIGYGQEFVNIDGESLGSIIKKADHGKGYYQGVLSRFYRNGIFVKTNYSGALDMAQKAAINNDILGYYNLARLYFAGKGVKKDSVHGREYLTKFINGYGMLKGKTKIGYELAVAGMYFYDSTFVRRDVKKALDHTYKAQKMGSTFSYYILGTFYRGIPGKLDSSIFCFKKSIVLTNCAASMNSLGAIYKAELRDTLPGVQFQIQGSNAGDALASHNLFIDKFSRKEYSEAFNFLKLSAEQGDPDFQIELGEFYENGDFFERDYEKAKYWYSKAAEQNLDQAQYRLAWIHFILDKTSMLENKIALGLLKVSAEAGNKNAINMETALGLYGSPQFPDE